MSFGGFVPRSSAWSAAQQARGRRRSNSSFKSLYDASRAAVRASTTTGRSISGSVRRNASRMRRFTRFRSHALPMRRPTMIARQHDASASPIRELRPRVSPLRSVVTAGPTHISMRRPWAGSWELRTARMRYPARVKRRTVSRSDVASNRRNTQTASRFRPLRRRRLITLRPPGVAMRARNP